MHVSEISLEQKNDKTVDILVDGKNLQEILGIEKADVVADSPQNFKSGSGNNMLSKILVGDSDVTGLLSGIAPVYVCSECGDYGCGVFGWKIDVGDVTVTWHSFQWDNNLNENNDEEESADDTDDELKNMKIIFDKDQYFEFIEKLHGSR